MGFGDLKKKEGLSVLNAYLADKSYIEGFQPSQADAVVFDALSGPPSADLENALRWYNHIKSYGAARSSFTGRKKDLSAYGPAGSGAPAAGGDDDDDDDDIDLFGSDDEDAKAERERRLAEYAAKKAKKPALIAKSSLLLDVKPWDDETDMAELEKCVRTIEADGLLWGASKLVPVGYGIRKLQINAVIEDDKISTDFLEDEITKFEDYVQSMDIAAFNKI
ncbi:elongation factor 1-beta [Magallana gigas]|uniref:Elongation factor 1-beta n=4 Tax=Magallana gigas TaxID=29159 RepID=A0A8W8M905_MAGGI|nr:elongation factor 1-beta [Crassostrea gigas]